MPVEECWVEFYLLYSHEDHILGVGNVLTLVELGIGVTKSEP